MYGEMQMREGSDHGTFWSTSLIFIWMYLRKTSG